MKKIEDIEKEAEKIVQDYKDHCCKYGCDGSCGKKIHGYCDFELDHGFDLEELLDVFEKTKSFYRQKISELVRECLKRKKTLGDVNPANQQALGAQKRESEITAAFKEAGVEL